MCHVNKIKIQRLPQNDERIKKKIIIPRYKRRIFKKGRRGLPELVMFQMVPPEIVPFQNKPRVGLVKLISFIAEFDNKNNCFI